MSKPQRDLFYAFLLALAALGLYAGFLSKGYVFEGLIRAMPMETPGRWGHIFPGNYLLYGPLGLVFHGVLNLLGWHQPAVISLQVMDALLGAAGIFVFYLLLRRLGGDVFSSVVWSVVLGCSLGYWLWSTEAEDYILSTVLLILNFYVLVRSSQRNQLDPVLIGALHALAILGHIVNSIFGVVILWFFFIAYGKKAFKPVGRYLSAAACVVLAAYAAVIVFVVKPAGPHEALRWFEGSAGISGGLSIGGGLSGAKLEEWLKMSLHIFTSFGPGYTQPPSWPVSQFFLGGAWALLGLFLGVFIRQIRDIYKKNPAVVGGCGLWLLVYAGVFIRWQPGTMVYRVSDLIPICLLLFLTYQMVSPRFLFWRGAAAALAGCLLIGNLSAEISPRSYASNNPNLARMEFLKAHTVEGNWIAGGGGQDEIYIPYFAERRPIVVDHYAGQTERLSAALDTLLAHGQSVFITSRVLELEDWNTFFKRYPYVLTARDSTGFALYRLSPSRKRIS